MVVRGVKVTREMIERATNLKVVGRHGVGFEGVDIDAAKAHGVHVVNAPLANATSVAELIVARFLEMSRDLYRANVGMRQGAFTRIAPPEMQGTEVTGKTLGLIGMGNIPQMVAHMMTAAFGVKVVGYDPFVPAEEAIRRGIEKATEVIVKELVAAAKDVETKDQIAATATISAADREGGYAGGSAGAVRSGDHQCASESPDREYDPRRFV